MGTQSAQNTEGSIAMFPVLKHNFWAMAHLLNYILPFYLPFCHRCWANVLSCAGKRKPGNSTHASGILHRGKGFSWGIFENLS